VRGTRKNQISRGILSPPCQTRLVVGIKVGRDILHERAGYRPIADKPARACERASGEWPEVEEGAFYPRHASTEERRSGRVKGRERGRRPLLHGRAALFSAIAAPSLRHARASTPLTYIRPWTCWTEGDVLSFASMMEARESLPRHSRKFHACNDVRLGNERFVAWKLKARKGRPRSSEPVIRDRRACGIQIWPFCLR